MSESEMAHGALKFGLLGTFEVSRDGEYLALGGRRQRAILAMLVCEAGHAVSVDRLVDGVWGEPAPSGVVTTVQSYVFHLRQVLEPDRPRGAAATVLVTVPSGYRLAVDPRSLDATRFEELVAAGDAALAHGNPERAATLYGQALSLWRGDVLADLSDHEFVAPVRARLEEERASALESRMQAELDLGHHQAVVAETGPLIAEHPLRERLHALRILALYRSGRQSDALAAYRELRSVLHTELGIEPSPPLQELNNQVLRQDPVLDWTPPAHRESAPRVATLSPDLVPAAVAPRTGSPRRRLAVIGAAMAVLAGGAALPVAGAPPASAEVLPNAVSELDASGKVLRSIAVGTNPVDLTSSPGAVWVANAGDDSVFKINTTTRAIEQKIPVRHDPRALAVTGDDLWVTNFVDGTVSRFNIPTGREMTAIDVGPGPDAIAAGPAGLWVANSKANTIQRIDYSLGEPGPAIDVGDGPDGLAVNDTSVWVSNGREATVMEINATTGEKTSGPIPVGSGPRGIISDGEDVWVADELSQTVARITAERPHLVDVGDGPTAVAVFGGSVWVAEKYSGNLTRIDPETGNADRISLGAPVHDLEVTGGHLWVASGAFASKSHLGGTLRVAAHDLPGEDDGIDPARVYDVWTSQALRVVYDGLLAFHYSSEDPQVLVPDLATSVPAPTDGGRTYVFNLRPGIKYSDGSDLYASDIAWGFQRALHPTAARNDTLAGVVGGQECIDDWSSCNLSRGVIADDPTGRVIFHLVEPDPAFLYKLTLLVVPAPDGTPLGELTNPMAATGPYQIATYQKKKTFALTRNPYFRQWSAAAQPAAFLDDITWLKVADAREAADAVQQGRADLTELTHAGGPDPTAVASILDELEMTELSRLHWTYREGATFVALNSSIPPFDNRNARRAFNFAIDRRKVAKLFGGSDLALPTCQLMPPTMPSYGYYCPYTTGRSDGRYRGPDLGKALALAQASGTQSTKITITDLDSSPQLHAYYRDVLRSLGYRVKLRLLRDTPHNRDLLGNPDGPLYSRIQVQGGIFIADYPLPSNIYEIVACGTSNLLAPLFYCNPELDQRAEKASQLRQTAPSDALRAWTDIDRTLTDEAPVVPVVTFVNWWFTSERVGNYQNGTDTIGPLLSQIWVT